jgi:hypothetical protein
MIGTASSTADYFTQHAVRQQSRPPATAATFSPLPIHRANLASAGACASTQNRDRAFIIRMSARVWTSGTTFAIAGELLAFDAQHLSDFVNLSYTIE